MNKEVLNYASSHRWLGDILLYRIGFTTEAEPEEIAQSRMDSLLNLILLNCETDDYIIYFSCGRNDSFRKKMYPEYKSNRKQPKPLHYAYLKNYLQTNWNTESSDNLEADDLIGMNLNENSIAATIDKDILYGLEGNKYHIVKEDRFYTSKEEALKFFYKQLLMGDTADNILGIIGVGKAKAEKILDGLEFEEEMFEAVQNAYRDWLHDYWADNIPEEGWTPFLEKQMNNIILLNGTMLKIWTKPDDYWKFPIEVDKEVEPILERMDRSTT